MFALFAVLAALGFVGCILSPSVEPPPPHHTSSYKDLTHKEDVVWNLVQCYKDRNIDRFKELLHLEYLWYNQNADVQNGAPEFNSRDQDIEMTDKLFKAANNQSPDPDLVVDRLDLSIASDPTGENWTAVDTLEGNPCEDCWQTLREYYITVEMNGGTKTLIGNDLVRMFVVPVTKDGIKHYYLRRAEDIKKP
jgi:hypothetical protein